MPGKATMRDWRRGSFFGFGGGGIGVTCCDEEGAVEDLGGKGFFETFGEELGLGRG